MERLTTHSGPTCHIPRPAQQDHQATDHSARSSLRPSIQTRPGVKAGNVSELIGTARKHSISFGAGSSSARVAAELFQQMTHTQLNCVLYKANPPAIVDLVGGQIDMMIVDPMPTSAVFR